MENNNNSNNNNNNLSTLRKSNINGGNSNIVQSCLSFLHRSLSIKKWIEKILGEKLSEDHHDDNDGLLLFGKLMNGVVLCKLMSCLKSNSIPKIHTGESILNFKIRENLCFYIQALEDIGISRHFQFQVPDLLEKKNLLKVLESLEVLADDCTDFEKPIELSDEESLLIQFTDKQLSDTEQILKKLNVTHIKKQSLKKLTSNEPKRFTTSGTTLSHSTGSRLTFGGGSGGSSNSPTGNGNGSGGSSLSHSGGGGGGGGGGAHHSSSTPSSLSSSGNGGGGGGSSLTQSGGSRTFQTRIVSTPANVKPKAPLSVAQILDKARPFEKRWIKIQAFFRGHLARKAYQKRVRFAAYRHNIVKELLATEQVYIDSLDHVVAHYFNPMREESSKLNIKLDHFGLLISNLEVIINYNKNLLQNIKPKVENWSHSQTIGDIFEQFTLYLKVYTQYVKEYSIFFEAINNLRKSNTKFESFIVEKEYNDNYKSIGTYLILPIQRIPRYTLLLTELLKNTWSDHLDYNNLQLSLKKMQEVALYVNEKKREAENIAKVTEIQNNFIGKFENLAEPHRRFVFEGHLSVIGPGGKESQRVVYLFNDVLISTKPITSGLVKKKVSLKVKESIRMNLVTIKSKSNNNIENSENNNNNNSNNNIANNNNTPTKISSTPKSSSASSLLSNSTPSSPSLSTTNTTTNTPQPTPTPISLSSSMPSQPTKPTTLKPVPPPRSQATFNVTSPTPNSTATNPTTTNSTTNNKPTIGVKTSSSSITISSTNKEVVESTKPRSSTTVVNNSTNINIHNQIRQPTPIASVTASSSQERLIIEEKMKKQNQTIELIDTFGTCVLKLLCSSVKEKDQWVSEIKKVYEDLDNKKIINDEAMKRSQERAGLAKAALSQQYATLRVKGRLCDLNTLKTSINQEEDGSSNNSSNNNSINNSPTTSSPIVNSVNGSGSGSGGEQQDGSTSNTTNTSGEREFNVLRRQTLSARRSQNNATPPPSQSQSTTTTTTNTNTNTNTTTNDSASDHSDTDEKKNEKSHSKTGTGWFSSLRKKKKHPSIQDTFGLDTSPITPSDTKSSTSTTTTPPPTSTPPQSNTVILKQDNL
ncbi:hypothetical protein ACTFIW_004182 [Dictyostelium discoideum]